MKDATRGVDALVRDVVRRILFSDLRSATPAPTPSPASVKTKELDETVTLPFAIGRHHAHVLSYASWSDVQLHDERGRLQAFLRTKQGEHCARPEQEEEGDAAETEETVALEALALLELFRHEREKQAPAATRLLHAQLALFARYFEASHARKILYAYDILAIEKSYTQAITSDQ